MNQAELAHICRGRLVESRHAITWKQFTSLGANRNVVLLSIMYFTQSYGFYFYITWLPTYLARVRGLKAAQLGLAAGLPLLISVLADLSGGLTTDWAVRRVGLRWGRAAVGVCSFVCASAFLIAGTVAADAATAALLIALAAACSNFPLGACWGTCLDIGGSQAGVVSACMNTAGQVGSLLSPLILGYVVANFASWTAPLFLTGALYSVGALCWLFINAERPIWSAEPTS